MLSGRGELSEAVIVTTIFTFDLISLWQLHRSLNPFLSQVMLTSMRKDDQKANMNLSFSLSSPLLLLLITLSNIICHLSYASCSHIVNCTWSLVVITKFVANRMRCIIFHVSLFPSLNPPPLTKRVFLCSQSLLVKRGSSLLKIRLSRQTPCDLFASS
jgi:hypothetical protein